MRRGHELLDKGAPWNEAAEVIEVGAGSGVHLEHVRSPYASYLITDTSEDMLAAAKARHAGKPGVSFAVENAAHLSFADSSFDRLIATHVLEHLWNPHEVLREWVRVVRPGGAVSIILPCDPGLAWRFGRHLGPRKRAEGVGLDYDYFQAREHVNSIYNLRTFIEYYFNEVAVTWWPLRVPSPDLNLLYIAHIKVLK
jgi:ubiquinone/menaquinone biosynthesis C-methylase UbiE